MNHYTIEQVLPHSQPMILLDELHRYGIDWAECIVNIKETSLFYDPSQQGVPSYVGIEYMAQTIAAFAGANALDNGQSVEIGYLLGSRKYQPEGEFFPQGSRLTVHVSRLYEEESGLRVFECQISDHQHCLVAAKVNVYLPVQEVEKGS